MKVATSGLRQDSPAMPLLQALISYQGVTDAAGAATGLTIVCGDLVNESSYDGQLLKIRSGPAAGQVKPIYVQAGNTLTFATPWTNAAGAVQQITAGTLFDILSISGGGGGPTPAPREGLSYYGIVNAFPGANQFTIGSLAGLGAGKFDGATNPYYAFVLRDAGGAGAAPQGEQLPLTAYATATGDFTTAAFTAAVAVGDEILILHPDVAAVLVILAGLAVPGVDSVVNLLMRDVVGNKADTALFAEAANASLMRYIKGLITAGIAVPGAVNDGAPAITDFDTDLAEATDNHYNGMLLMFIDGPNAGQAHTIDDYGGAARNVSFLAGDQWTDVPVNGNSFVILPTLGSLLRAIQTIPGADSAINVFMRDVLGNKTDTALYAPTAADSLMRYIKGILESVVGTTATRVMGRLQIAATTIDLNQVVGTYDLFTGTTQDVVVERLVIRMPNIVAGGALTSISIQTDDTTPQVFISAADGAVANLTAEAQLAWTGAILIDAGTGAKIRLTIAGGAHGVAYVCDVIAECRAVISGGYLA